MSPFTPLIVASTFLQMQSQSQAARAEAYRQKSLAAQYEQNADFQRLQGLQEHNARVDAFNSFIRQASVARAANNRTTSDRSYNAILKASREKSIDELRRAKTQNLFQQSRSRFASADARFSAESALYQGRIAGFQTMLSGAMKLSDIG
tara:strand:+ start:2000 stop:2446 length:447 start_codon:yes stop_codon:yes gene_type:complete